MKKIVLIMVLFLVNNTIRSQDRFFEFLPGWRNIKIVENGNNYISIGRTSDGIGLNHYQFSFISNIGLLLDDWEFDLDTVSSLESRYTNDISIIDQDYYISGSSISCGISKFINFKTVGAMLFKPPLATFVISLAIIKQ